MNTNKFLSTLLLSVAVSNFSISNVWVHRNDIFYKSLVLEKLVLQWNEAHNEKNYETFQRLYDNPIFFYGEYLNNEDCIKHKKTLWNKHEDFYQFITNKIEINEINQIQVKCEFIKKVNFSGVWKEYPSYLIFSLTPDGWKVSTESDLITDKNLSKKNRLNKKEILRMVDGDFNGDGVSEKMWLVEPKLNEEGDYCIDVCDSYIHFTNNRIPIIKITDCLSGQLRNLGDLNDDGTDEIGILPVWFTSCWRSYLVWTFRNGKWIHLVSPIPTHCAQWDQHEFPITKRQNQNKHVSITFSEFDGNDINIKKKIVKTN